MVACACCCVQFQSSCGCWMFFSPWDLRMVIPGGLCLAWYYPVSTVYSLKMSRKGKVVHSLGAQNRSVLCSHSIPFKAPKSVSGSMLLFRKFKASLGISERRNYSSSFEDEDKLGTFCWCNRHSSFYNFKQNLWPFKYFYFLIFQGDLLNLKVILMFGLFIYDCTLPGSLHKTPHWMSGPEEALGHLRLCGIQNLCFQMQLCH